MSILISATSLSKSFSARPLFDSITFAIETKERIGLIGPNGAGKSTLLKILAGMDEPDSGILARQKGLKSGFLAQVPTFQPHATVESTLLEGAQGLEDWEAILQAQSIMAQLSLHDPECPVERLSGGWKKRVALGRELMRQPDILFLDEPTNHLDLESILELEQLLADAPFSVFVITHDRYFLQKVTTRILELDRRNPHGLLSIPGDYTRYLETKTLLMAAQERQEEVLKNTLRRETEWLKQGAKARTTKQQARIDRAFELKDTVQELGARNQKRSVQLDFQGSQQNPKKLVEFKKVSHGYGNKTLFSDVDWTLSPGSRVALLGKNGCGKSTFVRILLGEETPHAGTVTRADSFSVAYFEQNRDTLDPTLTLTQTLCGHGDFVSYRGQPMHIRGYLDRFLFTSNQMQMRVGKLSGGEQSRLLLAKLMLESAQVLVLDEPTNDLDLPTLRILEECLIEFSGAVVLVTHDRYFLNQVATQILAFPSDSSPGTPHDKRLQIFASFSQWEQDRGQSKGSTQSSSSFQQSGQANSGSESGTPHKKRKKLSFNEQRELDNMEATLLGFEQTLTALTAESQLPIHAQNAVVLSQTAAKMAEVQEKIDELYVRWGELEARAGGSKT